MADEEKMHLRIKNPQILVRNCKFRTVDFIITEFNIVMGKMNPVNSLNYERNTNLCGCVLCLELL